MVTESDIQCLKDSIDKTVEIETRDGERLVAKVLFVIYDKEYDEHELIYEIISSSMPDFYSHSKSVGGYVLDFDEVVSVKPLC
jgi:hypothetical protein